jgi:hypothetical protein
MDEGSMREALALAQASERVGRFGPSDWPDLAVALLLAGVEDEEVAELAGFDRAVNGWVTEPLVESLYSAHSVTPAEVEQSVELVARVQAADLRARPAAVSSPMIRMLARVAAPNFESRLANDCYGAGEYLDCDCAEVDPSLESDLEALPAPSLPDAVVQALAAPLRATLPSVEPSRGH